jgi:ABC-type polysaccharide/polyol phosphate export permease
MLSVMVIMLFYHVLWMPIEMEDWGGMLAMLALSWFSGVAIGVVFLAIRPWFPEFVTVASSIYSRLNMVASGKMFVANMLPGYILPVFDWNPLFHTIDQARGYIFLNYTPHFSSPTYALWVGLALFMLGLMAENYTRKHASVSWAAGR